MEGTNDYSYRPGAIMTNNVDIRSSSLFSVLDDAQIKRVMQSSHMLNLADRQSLFECGDEADRFYLVTKGQIKLFRLSVNGDEKTIDIIQPGNTFAEALMFMEQPTYPVSATALGKVQLISFDNAQFLNLLRGNFDLCFRMMGSLCQRLRGLVKEIDDLTLQSATTRMCAMLVNHMEREGESEFPLQAPKGVLASRLSMKPETFSRILQNLANEGIIEVKGQNVGVLDECRLKESAHPESVIGLEPEFNCNHQMPFHQR